MAWVDITTHCQSITGRMSWNRRCVVFKYNVSVGTSELSDVDVQMLLNLHKKTWMKGLQLTDYKEHSSNNEKTIKVSYSCTCMQSVYCA